MRLALGQNPVNPFTRLRRNRDPTRRREEGGAANNGGPTRLVINLLLRAGVGGLGGGETWQILPCDVMRPKFWAFWIFTQECLSGRDSPVHSCKCSQRVE